MGGGGSCPKQPQVGSSPEHPPGAEPDPNFTQDQIQPQASPGGRSSPEHPPCLTPERSQPRASHGAKSSPEHPPFSGPQDSLAGHLQHLLDGAVARGHEVLGVLVHLDGLEPLGHRAERDALGAAGAGQADGDPAGMGPRRWCDVQGRAGGKPTVRKCRDAKSCKDKEKYIKK